MTNANGREPGPVLLRIEGEMTIYRALELKQTLLAKMEESAALDIDLTAVTEIDTAGVQLLLLAGRSAQAGQREVRVVACSPEVLDVIELLNLASHFCDSSGMSLPSA